MAKRRMFSLDVVDTDRFLELPASSQSLYFHLGMRADDDGFVSSPKKITSMVNCSNDDLKLLLAKEFLLPFESGVVVVTDWKVNNYIQKDRYNETQYTDEKRLLEVKDNGKYILRNTMDTECIQNVRKVDTQVRLGKDSIDKNNIYAQAINYLNEKAGTNYRATTKKTKELISAREKEGFLLENFKRVIDNKVAEWKGTDMEKYLRPETLFGTKFEGYLNQKINNKSSSKDKNYEECILT